LWRALVVVIAGLVIAQTAFAITFKQVESRVDPVTGSMSWKTVGLLGITLSSRVDVSPLETRLKSSGIAWTPSWEFLHNTHRNIFGRAIVYECGSAPPIYHIQRVLNHYVSVATDDELREFVRVMQSGTKAEQEAAVEVAGDKGLAAMASVCTVKTHSHYKGDSEDK